MTEQESSVTVRDEQESVVTTAERNYELTKREAGALAASDLVPEAYRRNVPNCLLALNLARRIGADPLMVMQSLDVIHGRPSFRASFLIACVNMCGRFTPLQYRIEGDGKTRSCVAHTTDAKTGEVIEGPPVSIQMAHDEGWATKKGSKWKTMPDLMLRYRAATFFARTVAPELTLGLHTTDELADIAAAPRADRPSARAASDALAAARDVTPQSDADSAASDAAENSWTK